MVAARQGGARRRDLDRAGRVYRLCDRSAMLVALVLAPIPTSSRRREAVSQRAGGAQTEEHAGAGVEPDDGEAALHAVATRSGAAAPMAGVARTVLREQVKELLIGRIVRGELGPGAPLVETRIAHELGTS